MGLLIGLLVALLTIAGLGVIFLAAFLRLWQNPPSLVVNLTGVKIPETLAVTLQHVPAEVETKTKDEPIPEEILDYISQESETHAQDARKRRVRALKVDTGSWDAAFRLLQKEDNSLA